MIVRRGAISAARVALILMSDQSLNV